MVRRRWAPGLGRETVGERLQRRVRDLRRKMKGGVDAVNEAGEGPLGLLEILAFVGLVFIAVVGVVLVAFLAILLVLPLLIVVIELVILMALVAAGVVGSIVFRRPWTIEAIEDHPDGRAAGAWRTWKVAGWRASGARLDEVAQQLANGVELG